jgi:hypothetical protein
LDRDRATLAQDTGSKHAAQRVVRITHLKICLEMARKDDRVGRAEGDSEIEILGRPRDAPRGDGKSPDQRKAFQQMMGLRVVESTDNFS